MDFLQRKHLASYRGKRGQQVWTMGVTAAYVKWLETNCKPTGKWTRAEVQSAFEELGVSLAQLIGEPAQKVVQDAFQMLDELFDKPASQRQRCGRLDLPSGGRRPLVVQVVPRAPQMGSDMS